MSKINVQIETFEAIKSLCSNYKKDGPARKTTEYLTKRLLSLESLWQDFQGRHQQLLESESKELQYFTDNVYEKTKQLYENTKTDILQRLLKDEAPRAEVVIPHSPETDTKTKELLVRQECNLKALQRAMAKINIDEISEKWELEDHIHIIKNKWEVVEKLHWELEAILKGSNEVYNDIFSNKERQYDHLRKALNSKIWASVHYQSSAPRIELPEFTGNYSQWTSFKDLFMETIHNNPVISKSQKMQHLKSKLKGEPEKLVQHLIISADNYETCWEILNQRYDNKRLQFTNLMNTMMQLPTIQQPQAAAIKKMHDVINECLNGLHNIGINVTNWDPLIVYLMSQKLDATSYNEYMRDLRHPRLVPDLDEFLSFLENKFMAYEAARNHQRETPNQHKQAPSYKNNANYNFNKRQFEHNKYKNYNKTYHTTFGNCPLCDGNHRLMQCTKFVDMDSYLRNNTVTKLQLCKNCLYSHGNVECKSHKTCKECSKPHHTLLHYVPKKGAPKHNTNNSGGQRPPPQPQQPPTNNEQSSNHLSNDKMEVLLPTVELQVKTVAGSFITLRALLDQGSQVNLITENAAQRLKLPRKKLNATISGVGTVSGDCKGRIGLECKSNSTDFTFQTDALIITRITNNLPNKTFENNNWTHIQGLKLADPHFNISRNIDILLGADVYSQVILEGVLKGDCQAPTAQQTQLGWILCGKLQTFNCHVALVNINELTQFWETEDIIQTNEDTSKDDWCENYFQKTTRRDSKGKYIVKMPLVPDFAKKLGKSKPMAISQFLQLERRFERKQKLASMYKDFINEYIEMGHMIPSTSSTSNHENYLPHHGILREQSTTTKLRAVFNASQKTKSGYSLNDVMEKGPNLQKDIQALILQWRTYKIVYTADIEKMYRCISIDPEQQPLQKIIWRNNPSENLREYQLATVTYGTKSAPWLAIRTLKQLANDDEHKYPEAAEVLRNHFYVDDLVSGHNSVNSAKHVQQTLINLLKGAGMNLRKWTSNYPELLHNLTEDQISKQSIFDFKNDETMATLGLRWNPKSDVFIFNWNIEEDSKQITKRSLLSQISRLYDPLGWLSPITVAAKLLFQRVWMSKITWDENLPNDIQTEWATLKNELHLIKTMRITRWLGGVQRSIQLHGFCDASEKAYACVIYSHVINENGETKVTLLAAKTRVVPTAHKITLPRLELCGALLLSQLMQKVKTSLPDCNLTTKAWCDSKVVLAWLQGDSTKWERYVANRVTKIIAVVPARQWHYVKSEHNPADCASRGILPSKMVKFRLWWQGPTFLENVQELQVQENINCLFTTNEECINDLRNNNKPTNNEENNFIYKLLNDRSSLTQVTRIVAQVMRFVTILRCKQRSVTQYLTTSELKTAAEYILQCVQQCEFAKEYIQLKLKKNITLRSNIIKLNPYLDSKGTMRVGGRLQHSQLPINMKNPAIVPYSSRFTQLLIDHAHHATLHGGARLTLSYLRQRYWIIAGNRAVKAKIRLCVKCHRFNATETSQLMGDLPKQRITPSRPFTFTGVDFTGYVEVKLNKGRGVKTTKAYIAIFVCMVTKAVHIELVSELSTEAFIAAFQRMCARRGTPSHVYSDNGTNFVGACRVLKTEFEAFKKLLSPEFFDEIGKLGVEWHFNAPSWPSAGGLYEAAVKSMKYHLRRILGDQKLTWEEFTTLLAKIEACMNSRPLCPLTEDPEEFYNCITPGHFLTGSPTLSLPQPNCEDRILDLRKRWQLTEHMLEQFWKAWSNDYLTTLQTRCKWQKPLKNLQENDVVLIKETNIPPGKWAMGRIVEVHPGRDGLVRVATLKTKTGLLKRPVIKLSPLPIENNAEETKPINKHSEVKSKRTKKPEIMKSLLAFATLLTVMLTLITGSNCTDRPTETHITKLEPDRPVYYDEMGKINLIHDEWILLMFYNLTTYWQGTKQIKQYIENVNDICTKMDPRYCQATLDQLKHEMGQLEYYNEMLLSPHKHLSLRKKRGLINGVGYLANSLFGVLDERFAEKYQQDIQNIQNNEDYLLELSRNQTSIIVEVENDILKKNEANIKRQFNLIHDFTEQTNLNLAKVENEMEAVMAASYFSSSSLTAYLLLNNLKRVQELILNSIMQVYQGHLDVHLLAPSILGKQLDEIAGKLPKSLSIPGDRSQGLKDVYKLICVKARTTETCVLYEIHIPLLCDEEFTLYGIIPLPIKYNNTTQQLQITTTHIAVNFRKNSYVSLTTEDLKQCSQQGYDSFTCNAVLPVHNLHNYNAPCEAKLISQRATSACEIRSSSCKDAWIKLHTLDNWLTFCCDGDCLLRIICNDEVTVHTITNSNIITLGQGCIVQSKEVTIYSHNVYKSDVKINPTLQIPTLNTSINKIINLTLHNTPDVLSTNELEQAEIDRRISSLKESEKRSLNIITSHDIHQYTICYILVGVNVAAAVGWTVKNRCRPFCKKQEPLHETSNKAHYEDIELREITAAATVAAAGGARSSHSGGRGELSGAIPRSEAPRRKNSNNPTFSFE